LELEIFKYFALGARCARRADFAVREMRGRWVETGSLPRIAVVMQEVRGERFGAELPPQVQMRININLGKVGSGEQGTKVVPFAVKVAYDPPIAEIVIKGSVVVFPEAPIHRGMKVGDYPPTELMNIVASAAIPAACILAYMLGIPAPVPPIQLQQQQGAPLST